MRALNRSYRGQDKATDILSFVKFVKEDLPFPEYENAVIGDIVIDINQVAKQKGTNTFAQELLIVFIHGMLHIMGYDHTKKIEKENMEELVRMYLKKVQGEIYSG